MGDADDDAFSFDRISEPVADAVDRDIDEENVRLATYHRSLPQFRESGLLEYDERSETLRYYEPSPAVADLVDCISELRESDG